MKTSLKIICILFFAFLTLNSFSQETKVKIGFIGNSITIGRFLPDEVNDRYPARFRVMLTELYGDLVEVENFAVSGRTMLKNGDLPIWVEQRFAEALVYAPDICFILLGTNDTKPQNWDSYSDQFFGDYLSMIDTFKAVNPETKFVVGYPPWIRETWGGIDNGKLVNGVIPAIDSILKVTDAILMDFYQPFFGKDELYTDPVHPNAAGAEYMAELIYDLFLDIDLIPEVAGYPVIKTFESDQDSVPVLDSVTLSWTTINADSVKLDDQLVPLNGSKKVTSSENTSYSLIAYNEKGTDTLVIDQVYYITGNLQQETSLESITIFPNPVGENMNILLEDCLKASVNVKLYSMSGQLLVEKDYKLTDIHNQLIVFNAGNIPDGIYIVEVEADNKKFKQKITRCK
jgi:lysophospholipase L1-like esterase